MSASSLAKSQPTILQSCEQQIIRRASNCNLNTLAFGCEVVVVAAAALAAACAAAAAAVDARSVLPISGTGVVASEATSRLAPARAAASAM